MSASGGRVPPRNKRPVPAIDQAAERAVLGGILLVGTASHVQGLAARGLAAEHFYWSAHGRIFTAARSLASSGSAVDAILLAAELERDGDPIAGEKIDELAAYCPAAAHFAEYADRVMELAEWRRRREVIHKLADAADGRRGDEWAHLLGVLVPKPTEAPKRRKTTGQGTLRLVVDPGTGEVLERGCDQCRELGDQLSGAHTEIRAWRSRYARLERDAEKDARESEFWPQAVALFGLWKEKTGHARSKWTLDRYLVCEPMLRVYGLAMCERAITGLAFDPFTRVMKNGATKRYDEFGRPFKNADEFESWANRAPRDWVPTLRVQAAAVASSAAKEKAS